MKTKTRTKTKKTRYEEEEDEEEEDKEEQEEEENCQFSVFSPFLSFLSVHAFPSDSCFCFLSLTPSLFQFLWFCFVSCCFHLFLLVVCLLLLEASFLFCSLLFFNFLSSFLFVLIASFLSFWSLFPTFFVFCSFYSPCLSIFLAFLLSFLLFSCFLLFLLLSVFHSAFLHCFSSPSCFVL